MPGRAIRTPMHDLSVGVLEIENRNSTSVDW